MRDMIKDQVIEINFVKSAENDSDIMTKNQQGLRAKNLCCNIIVVFLKCTLEKGLDCFQHKMYLKVPQGFEKWYGRGVVLLL